ncbi:PEP-CTERM sorting domain-containing protein [Roseateles sp.]|uniref:PEP-CTERM sorting domain-containing protein n=1 Tax=Roseateles sp. TaxID=1971397 RepID=UPI0039E05ACA
MAAADAAGFGNGPALWRVEQRPADGREHREHRRCRRPVSIINLYVNAPDVGSAGRRNQAAGAQPAMHSRAEIAHDQTWGGSFDRCSFRLASFDSVIAPGTVWHAHWTWHGVNLPIPEPSTFLLMLAGLGFATLARRRLVG